MTLTCLCLHLFCLLSALTHSSCLQKTGTQASAMVVAFGHTTAFLLAAAFLVSCTTAGKSPSTNERWEDAVLDPGWFNNMRCLFRWTNLWEQWKQTSKSVIKPSQLSNEPLFLAFIHWQIEMKNVLIHNYLPITQL